MKKILLNFTLLITLVCCVYLARKSVGIVALSDDEIDDFERSVRNLAGTQYATQACANVKNSSNLVREFQSLSKINAALFGTSRSTNYLESNVLMASFSISNLIGYAKSFIPLVAPWIVLWKLGNILNIIFCCNQCCMIGCYKNCCLNICKCCKKPKKDRKMLRIISGVIAIATSVGVLGAAAGGLTFTSRLSGDYNNLNCAVFQGFDAFVFGNQTGKWTGIDGANTKMQQISETFSTKFSTSNYNTGPLIASAQSASNTYENQLSTTFGTYGSQTVRSANPTGGSAIKPDIIKNLGPMTDTTSLFGEINNERATTLSLAEDSAATIQSNYDSIKGSLSSYQSSIDSAADATDSLNKMFQDIESSAYSVTSQGESFIKSYIHKALTGVFAGALVMSILTIFCPIAVCLFKKPFCNSMIFVAWEAFYWMAFLGFLLGTICLMFGIVLSQSCDIMYKTLETKGYINKIVSSWLNDVTYIDYVNTCLFDDGDIIRRFGVTDIFGNLNEIETTMDAVASLYRPTTIPDSVFIEGLKAKLTNTISGKYYMVAGDSETDGTAYNLREMNKLADYSVSGSTQSSTAACSRSQDQWVMNDVNCTYSPTWTGVNANNYNFGSQTCIGISSTIDDNARYDSTSMAGCGPVSGIPIYTRLYDYRDKLKGQFDDGVHSSVLGGLNSDVNGQISPKYNNFMESIYDITDEIATLQTGVNEILALVTDPTTGLVSNLNCAFFRYGLRSLQSTMCSGLINTFLQITTCLVLMSLFGCVGSVFQFTFAKFMRTKLEEEKNDQQPNHNQVKDESDLEKMSPPPESYGQSPFDHHKL